MKFYLLQMLTALTAGMMAVFRFPSLTTASEVLSQLKRMLDAIPDFPSVRLIA